ncbi:MAG: transporter substrate-binding protein [Acidimicrobiales bacterium]|nr:transporter substrate-binding protein [Acidimicrobiales bacterium]
MHQHVHRARPVAVLLVLLALVATACGSDSKGTEASANTTQATTAPADLDLSGVTLRVGDLGGTQQAGLEAAGESDTPYKIEWSQFPSGPPAVEAINAGAVDIAIMGDTPPIFAAAGGVDTKVVAVARPKDGNQPYLQILVPEGSDIHTVADLKSKTVAVAQQTILEYFLRKALAKEGLDIGDVKPAYLQPADGQAAYSSGKADAFVSIEPLTTITNSAKKSRAIASSNDYFISQTLAVARGKALKDPKVSAALGDYLQRIVRTYQWEQDHIEAWVPIYVKTTKFPATLAAATIASTAVAWQPIGDDVFKVQQDQIDTWAEAGAVPSGLKAKDEFDTRFNTLIKEVAK